VGELISGGGRVPLKGKVIDLRCPVRRWIIVCVCVCVCVWWGERRVVGETKMSSRL